MSGRYIDADALKFVIEKNFGHGTIKPILQLIDEQPTADVVEVVRCKNCVYCHPSYCEIWSKQTREQGHCYMGMHNYTWGADE